MVICIYIYGVSVWVSSWRLMGSGIGMALVSLAWILIRVSDGAAISKRVVNSVLRIMDIAKRDAFGCPRALDISALSGISWISLRYQVSVSSISDIGIGIIYISYRYICIYISGIGIGISLVSHGYRYWYGIGISRLVHGIQARYRYR